MRKFSINRFYVFSHVPTFFTELGNCRHYELEEIRPVAGGLFENKSRIFWRQ